MEPSDETGGDGPSQPALEWLGESENPWGVPLLDVRPVTQHDFLASVDPACATNAVSFGQDDGQGFIGAQPPVERTTSMSLRFPIDRCLAPGVLFTPSEMEHRWAIFCHHDRILFVDSWRRELTAVASVQDHGDHVIVSAVQGAFVDEDEPPSLTVRACDFLLVSHALGMSYPAPIPEELAGDPRAAASWCMFRFGRLALWATPHGFERHDPELPLRTYSLLHIAAAQADTAAIRRHLAAGIPVDLLDRDGFAPLHWAQDPATASFFLDLGAEVDVRSSGGTTPLMTAVAKADRELASWFLDHGADVQAQDSKGITALHIAAEQGVEDLVKMLLDHGASAAVSAQGHTPASLAALRGHAAIADVISRHPRAP